MGGLTTTVIYPTSSSNLEYMLGELDSQGNVYKFTPLHLDTPIGTGDLNMLYLVVIQTTEPLGKLDVTILDKYKAFAKRLLWLEESIDTLTESGSIDTVKIANAMLERWHSERKTRFH